jgi:5S rRNA maturation endonuclease (ribonuclease M5)
MSIDFDDFKDFKSADDYQGPTTKEFEKKAQKSRDTDKAYIEGYWNRDGDATSRFQAALIECGIDYKTTRRSIIIKECPSCGKQWKLWMLRPDPIKHGGRTGGQCWRCGEKFSSYSLLVACGVEERRARKILGIGARSPDLSPESWQIEDFGSAQEIIKTEQIFEEVKIPIHLVKIADWDTHPASKYAARRGLIKPLSESCFINPLHNAVSFPILYEDKLAGFQHRYVAPSDPNFRMKTDPGVPRGSSFIFFGNEEDPPCIVEGPFDAVAAAWFGFYGVATMGKEITRAQAQEIASMTTRSKERMVYIALDSDEAGEQGASSLARYLDTFGVPFKRLLTGSDAKDLNERLCQILDPTTYKEIGLLDRDTYLTVNPDWAWDLMFLGELDFTQTRAAYTERKALPTFIDSEKDDLKFVSRYSWKQIRNDPSLTKPPQYPKRQKDKSGIRVYKKGRK